MVLLDDDSEPTAAGSGLTAESRRTRSQISVSIMQCAYERISNENFLCTCNHGNAAALANARCCRHALSDPAMSRVRRHRLYPVSGAMRDRDAIPSPQVIPGGGKAAVLLLLSVVLASNDGQYVERFAKPITFVKLRLMGSLSLSSGRPKADPLAILAPRICTVVRDLSIVSDIARVHEGG
jgi:hypothetical protein